MRKLAMAALGGHSSSMSPVSVTCWVVTACTLSRSDLFKEPYAKSAALQSVRNSFIFLTGETTCNA